MLKHIMVKSCAQQGLPLRGHRDNSREDYAGNVMAILKGFSDFHPFCKFVISILYTNPGFHRSLTGMKPDYNNKYKSLMFV